MKRKIAVLFLVFALLVCPFISITKADNSSIISEYDADLSVSDTQKIVAFHVLMIIETELNGTWKPDAYYNISYVISLTYVNDTILSPHVFSRLFFHDPMILVRSGTPCLLPCNQSYGNGSFQILDNETSVWFGHDGVETLSYSMNGVSRFMLSGMLNYQVVDTKNETLIGAARWTSAYPIWMDIETASTLSPDYVTPLLWFGLGVVTTTGFVGTYLSYKSRNKKKKDMTVQK
jgi:hypothetical protein